MAALGALIAWRYLPAREAEAPGEADTSADTDGALATVSS